jgi:hypothetical protein
MTKKTLHKKTHKHGNKDLPELTAILTKKQNQQIINNFVFINTGKVTIEILGH